MTRDSDSPLSAIAQSRIASGTEMDAQGVVEVVGVSLDALLSFYEALGFRTERRTDAFAVVNGYGMRLFLAEDSNALIGQRWTSVRIVVPDVDPIWERVKSLGLPIVHTVGDRPYGLRDFVVADPSGFEIRFAQVLGSVAGQIGKSLDREQIDSLIAEFFAAFDNRNGAAPSLDAILGCFAEKAVIARSSGSDTHLFTPTEFAAPRIELLTNGSLLDFHEAEDSAHTCILGKQAIRTSRYRKAGVMQGAPYSGAGTKTFQLVAIASGWRILSLAWADDET